MTKYSDVDGNTTDDSSDTDFPLGPYIKKEMPRNPLPAGGVSEAAASDVSVDTVTTTLGTEGADGTPTTGWKFVLATGEFMANNTDYADR